MNKDDQDKNTFDVTPWETFCWVIMPFGLKNVGATYQIAMVRMFHDMIHDNVKVYVDDILPKFIAKYDHILYLRKIFQTMREYKLKLKPQKCAFIVSSAKLLSFIISRRGIKIDPKKVSAIVDLFPPNNLKDLRSFQEKAQAMRRVIAQLVYMTSSFSHLLKKGEKFIWDEKCQKALDKIKNYLTNALVLVPYD